MEEKNINVSLYGEEDNYEYKGVATIHKDIIKFSDKEDTYILDNSLERLTKFSKEKTIAIDFKNGSIKVTIDSKEINIPIKVDKIMNESNKKEYIYSTEDTKEKRLVIEIEV